MRVILILLSLLALGTLAIGSTYSVFGHTWDEPEHLAAGVRLLSGEDYGRYAENPPLGHAALALGPFLRGAHSFLDPNLGYGQEGNEILYREGHYQYFLTLSRIGVLPFFVLLVLTTFVFTKFIWDEDCALLAVYLVVTTPVILGHAALASLDVPMAATTLLALYALLRWIESPRVLSALALGLTAGAAVATKFTAIPVLGSVTLTWLAAKFLLLRRSSSDGERLPPFSWTRITGQLLLIASICLAVLVCSYLRSAGEGWRLFTLGLEIVRKHNKEGHLAYFLGELRGGGWWYFYPVVLAVKTPIPLLCSTFLGSVWVVIRNRRSASFSEFSPLLAILSVLLFFCAFNRINIGARHVMILFPLMAIVSSPLLMHYLRSRTGFLERGFSSGVLLLQLAIVIQAHPDYLAYCNLIAGEHPERIINDSDLDWGQDLRRLEAELRRRDIREINLIYRGSADLSREDLPRFHLISPSDRPSGWLAVSLLAKATGDPKHGYSWLNQYQPVVRIGKSIDLYNIPATPSP